jgi:hypothetical protein
MKKQSQIITNSLALTAVAALGVSVAQAQVVNYSTVGNFYSPYVGQGAYSDPGNNDWNVMVRDGTTAFDTTSSGADTGVTLTDTSPGQYNGGEGAQSNGQPSGFFAGFFLGGSSAVVTETLNNVPAATYDLYLYGSNTGQDRGATFSLTGFGSQSTVNVNAVNGAESPATAFTVGVDYVEFTGITLATAGDISFTYTANTAINRNNNGGALGDYNGVNTEGDFNGLQLVTVPEPSTMALATIGGLSGLLALRKNRQYSKLS